MFPLRPAAVMALGCVSMVFADDSLPKPPMAELDTYVVGFLKKGPNWGSGSKEESARIQEGHLANIRKMAEAGKLLLAGPFGDNADLRGMFVFRVDSMAEARELTEADPAVKSGRLGGRITSLVFPKGNYHAAPSEAVIRFVIREGAPN